MSESQVGNHWPPKTASFRGFSSETKMTLTTSISFDGGLTSKTMSDSLQHSSSPKRGVITPKRSIFTLVLAGSQQGTLPAQSKLIE